MKQIDFLKSLKSILFKVIYIGHSNLHLWTIQSTYIFIKGFPGGAIIKNPPAVWETQETKFWSLGWEGPLE